MDRSKEQYKKQLERSRNWKQNNKERHAELAVAYRARNREKTQAQNKLNYAIRKGVLSRLPCEVCYTDKNVHAHHEDYTKPLDVRWLCFQCHKDTHPVDDTDKEIKFEGAKHASLPGELNPNSNLTNEQVNKIRALLILGISQTIIAKMVNVSQGTISRIKLRKVYNF